MKIGVIGCGNISPAYFKGCKLYENIEVVACADVAREAAEKRAEEFGVPQVLEVDELLGHPEVDIVLNITTPQFHAPINKRILEAGKHAYCEKPFATTREEGREVLELAKAKGLYVGCAPDTFLNGALQTGRELIDAGAIGTPVGGSISCAGRGHEFWHPNPEFYYKLGGGPLFDMGPYYLTTLANCLGPVESVMASAKKCFAEREILSEPLKGKIMQVEAYTHYNGILNFESGATIASLFSFDMRGRSEQPTMIIYGTEGTLSLPDPNRFDGAVRISKEARGDWEDVPVERGYTGTRSLGLSEMADAIRAGRPMRASGEMAYHVFDVMVAHEDSDREGRRVKVASTFERPRIMPLVKEGLPGY